MGSRPTNKQVVSTLGSGIRTSAPSRSNIYYSKSGLNYFQSTYNGFNSNGNCTWYAYGRFMEIQGKGKNSIPPIIGVGGESDAGKWRYRLNKQCATGTVPEAGAVAVFYDANGKTNGYGRGHVMIVEEVYSDGTYWFTDSGYGYYLWQDGLSVNGTGGRGQVRSWMNSNGKSYYKDYVLWKFIYNPAVHSGGSINYNIEDSSENYVDPDYEIYGAETPSGDFKYEKPNNKHIILLGDLIY